MNLNLNAFFWSKLQGRYHDFFNSRRETANTPKLLSKNSLSLTKVSYCCYVESVSRISLSLFLSDHRRVARNEKNQKKKKCSIMTTSNEN